MVHNRSEENLWSVFPGCHLHVDVTTAGVNSYRIMVSVFSEAGNEIHRITHYGSGDLATIKEDAIAKLLRSLEIVGV